MTPRTNPQFQKNRRLTVMHGTDLTFPALYLEVFVAGDRVEQSRFARMFARSQCTKADSPDKADLVVFTGGDDVDPALYGAKQHHSTRFSVKRDQEDINLYKLCLDNGIPMFGVCRGAQFLHVMNGGKLYQDVDSHVGDHPIWDIKAHKHIRRTSSVHHQMVIRNTLGGMEVVADTYQSTKRWVDNNESSSGKMSDVEAFFYPDTACFGVQGHPEYEGYNSYLQWTLEKIEEMFVTNPDIQVEDKFRRLKKCIRDQRDHVTLKQLEKMN